MTKDSKNVRHEVYPKPEHRFANARIGMTHHDSKPDFPPIDNAPPHAPNVVIVLLDDVGYGWPSACGGLVRMPAAEKLAREGLTYCQFHTTGLCAPTRAALLTGRNHHSVSTGVVQEMATGFPGYSGILPKSCATVAKILSHNGYATGWWGKNHNTPDSQTSPAGPFTNWPTGLGFDYFYGFMGGETDQFYPALFRNTVSVEAPASPEQGYHLTTDLADDCITWMRTQKAIAPDRPLFVHFAPGAAHAPHQPPPGWRGRNAGRFGMGWERYREVVLERQLEMGVVAPKTRLTARPAEIPSWENFSAEERQLFERQVENFSDFLEHTDYEVGRLLQSLHEMGELENTLFIYILGDNGSSAEGSIRGTISELAAMQGVEPPIKASLDRINELGLPGTSPHFAVGWAWAGDTPFQWVKQIASHFGATRNAMIVSWPAGISDAGSTRFQFHHVIDVLPTILEVVGIAEPTM
ncbi:MAG TPA: sulfatase-like hydrolase/transferase, partial [Terriglobales bacterium]|nr:sulfatase-like hydrolase/transferase [Terriglobales bacterium]